MQPTYSMSTSTSICQQYPCLTLLHVPIPHSDHNHQNQGSKYFKFFTIPIKKSKGTYNISFHFKYLQNDFILILRCKRSWKSWILCLMFCEWHSSFLFLTVRYYYYWILVQRRMFFFFFVVCPFFPHFFIHNEEITYEKTNGTKILCWYCITHTHLFTKVIIMLFFFFLKRYIKLHSHNDMEWNTKMNVWIIQN